MKKIGILTRRAGFNHGSSLQAYAMAKFISDLGFECKILNYDEYSGNPRWKIRPCIENIQWIFFRPLIYLLAPSKYYYLHIRQQQYTKFAEFEDTFYNLTSPILTNTEALRKASISFDALVCGSDQIWSPLSYDPVFLFDFLNDNKINTIAYAPSIGVSDIHMISGQQRKLMCKIKNLSCRELQGSEMVKEITQRDCPTVLDPTLMVNSKHWAKMASSIPNVEKSSYIVCYFLGKNVHQTYVDELKHLTGCKVLNIMMFNRLNNLHCDRTVTDVGPLEFLNLIKNASYVCTDSFHGTIFSFHFQKKLSLFERFNSGEKDNQNSRIYTLLHNLQYEKVLIKEGDLPCRDCEIDYTKCEAALKQWVDLSESYISNALNQD